MDYPATKIARAYPSTSQHSQFRFVVPEQFVAAKPTRLRIVCECYTAYHWLPSVLMRLRKKNLPVVPLDDPLETEEESSKKEPGAPDQKLAGSVDRMQIQRAVDALPPGYRTIFVLHDVQGYEHNEIADLVGCSIGNSKSQLHKARMKLRDLLKTSRAAKAETH